MSDFSKNQILLRFPVVLHFQKIFVTRHVSQTNNIEFYSTIKICWQKCWCSRFSRLFRKESSLIIGTYHKNPQLLADSIYRIFVAGHVTQQLKHFFSIVVLYFSTTFKQTVWYFDECVTFRDFRKKQVCFAVAIRKLQSFGYIDPWFFQCKQFFGEENQQTCFAYKKMSIETMVEALEKVVVCLLEEK